MAEQIYKIIRTIPTVYLDKMGAAVNGYQLTVDLYAYDETHTLNVSNLDPKTADSAIKQLIAWRAALDKLGA